MASETLIVPKWMEIAEKELGQHEVAGPQANPRIAEYHQQTSLKATSDEVPWCSSFANWVMIQAGLRGTYSAAARSWESWGDPLSKPKFGCIVVMKRGTGGQGHVGFYVGEGPDHVKVLGGNQGDQVSIANFNKQNVIGYRWPREAK